MAADRYGDKTAIISGENRLSYKNLDRESNRAAHALCQLGIGRGDKVAFLLGNSPDFIVAFFGVVKIGAIAIPLDPKYKLTELTSLFNDCQPEFLLTESPCLEMISAVWEKFPFLKNILNLGPRPSTQPGIGLDAGTDNYADLLSSGSPEPLLFEPGADDTAVIAYTSGASLSPRGIMLSHQSIAIEAEISGEGFAQTERDIVPVFALPLHHAAGLTIVGLTSLYRGSTLVMMSGMSVPSLLETIEKERATLFIGVPFIYSLMVRYAEEEGIKNDLSSLRLCAGGGSPVSVELDRRFKELYDHHIAQFWGLTEISAHITVQAPDGSGIPGSIGKPLRGCEVRVIDETGQELPPGRTGELICCGPLMKGYYNNPEATAEIIKNGWLQTGDIGHIDVDGNIFITGRKKDLIIPKGQNIVPSDIETVLLKHSKVAEAAVLGIPDNPRGEVIIAIIHLKSGQTATESEMRRLCLENLANFKVPKEYTFVDFTLRSTDGRIDKETLRTRLALQPVFPNNPS
jgi:long-chain acyl-CoA synthetase